MDIFMKTCPVCGIELPEDRNYCPKCGAAQDIPPEAEYGYIDGGTAGDYENTAYDDGGYGHNNRNYSGSYRQPKDQGGYFDPTPAYTYDAKGPSSPLGVGAFLGSIIAMSLPVIGLFIQIIWACGGAKNLNRRSMARAYLILSVIMLILTFALLVYIAPYVVDFIDMVEPYLG